MPLYTYTLSTKDYGIADLLTITVQLLIPVLTLNIQDGVLRFSLDKNYNSDDVIAVGIKINIISGTILAIILFAFKTFNLLTLDKKYLYFLFFAYFLELYIIYFLCI